MIKPFRVDGHTFGIDEYRNLYYFAPNFDPITGVAGMDGFFHRIGKIFKKVVKIGIKVAPIAAAGYGIYSFAAAPGATFGAKLAAGAKNFAGGIMHILPSKKTVQKAAEVGGQLLEAAAPVAAAVIASKSDGQIPRDPGMSFPTQDKFNYPTDQQYGVANQPPQSGLNIGMDKNTWLLLGGAAIILILALRK